VVTGTSSGTWAFHCERRARVLDRDIFLLGTAMTASFLYARLGLSSPLVELVETLASPTDG
jgi:hypothetical protein